MNPVHRIASTCIGALLLIGSNTATPALAKSAPALPAAVAGLPTTEPEDVGISSERLKRMDRAMQDMVDQNLFAGISTVAARHGKVFYAKSIGYSDLDRKTPQALDTIGRMYSMTKTVTSVAMMILYEEGKWTPEDPIAKYIPEFANLKVIKSVNADGTFVVEEPKHAPTMGELMSHTAGFGYGTYGEKPTDRIYNDASGRNILFTADSMQEVIDLVATKPLVYQPGSAFAYSVSSDIQAYLVEKLSGMPFETFLKQRIFDPLGMKDSHFFVPRSKADRVSVFFERTEDGKLIPHRSADAFDGKFPQGGGGLWSTTADYIRFAQMLANGGKLDDVRILGPATARFMMASHMAEDVGSDPGSYEILPDGMKFAYNGAVYTQPSVAGCPCGKGTYWWAGASGAYFWIDPENDLVVVGFVQRLDFTNTTPLMAFVARPPIYQALIDPGK